jgi:hypothetical protein
MPHFSVEARERMGLTPHNDRPALTSLGAAHHLPDFRERRNAASFVPALPFWVRPLFTIRCPYIAVNNCSSPIGGRLPTKSTLRAPPAVLRGLHRSRAPRAKKEP